MIRSMPTTGCPQQRYDHRLQHLVHSTRSVTVATNLGVPPSTARGWLGAAPTAVVCLDVGDLTEPELRQEVLKLRRRVPNSQRRSRSCWPCYERPGFAAQQSACRTDATRYGSCAPDPGVVWRRRFCGCASIEFLDTTRSAILARRRSLHRGDGGSLPPSRKIFILSSRCVNVAVRRALSASRAASSGKIELSKTNS
jgi:hypothetical protein